MDLLLEEHERLVTRGNLGRSVDDVQKTIDLLVKARESIATSMQSIPQASTDLEALAPPPSYVKLKISILLETHSSRSRFCIDHSRKTSNSGQAVV